MYNEAPSNLAGAVCKSNMQPVKMMARGDNPFLGPPRRLLRRIGSGIRVIASFQKIPRLVGRLGS